MKIQTNQRGFSTGITAVLEAVPSRPVLPILSNILLRVEDQLSFVATDLDLSILTSIDVAVQEPGAIAVTARKLAEIVRELPQDKDITLSSSDHRLSIELAGNDLHRGVYTIAGVDPGDFPQIPDLSGAPSFVLNTGGRITPQDMAMMVHKTAFAASREDQMRPVLGGVLCRARGNRLEMVATDGHRLAWMSKESDDLQEFEAVIPPRALNLLPKFIDETTERMTISVSESFVRFDVGSTIIASRLIEGPYVAFEQIVPRESQKTAIIRNEDYLIPAVRRMAILASAQTRQVRLLFTRGRIDLTTTSAETGSEAKETIPASYVGDDMEVAYNAGYFLDILRRIDDAEVAIDLNTPVSAGVIRPQRQEEGMVQRYLLMPLRLTER
jgi:DNA polymerase-3 subunit beta